MWFACVAYVVARTAEVPISQAFNFFRYDNVYPAASGLLAAWSQAVSKVRRTRVRVVSILVELQVKQVQ